MPSFQTTYRYAASFLLSGIFFFLGSITVFLPTYIYIGGEKGGDLDYISGLEFYLLIILLFSGIVMFFDLLIVRFLFKLNLHNKMYFIGGVIFFCILGLLVFLKIL